MNVAAFTPSWHAVFPSREYGLDIYHHEFVHNEQRKQSYAWEKIGEDYKGYKDWDRDSVKNCLNWQRGTGVPFTAGPYVHFRRANSTNRDIGARGIMAACVECLSAL